ncbi:flagella synthesis protein FlgN [Pseudomonas sp. 5P_3.1_Bac2]|uniref:flagella synthesis protein FlgN n=1 Tax=Pseudomonas sp. 5P_3.1_Bac2 TaxID=2971617 RepID=UPI0021C67DC3|nr:flagellar protein FlgN [Pseudomonas sp. 5P_3.1_Bac2]MCU1715787.1 flagellar export chaperone FlgN [Pseudomonas sp. 5P_3.1_Bac2]
MHDTQLLELFTQDIGSAEQLLELIETEFQALNARDLSELQSILSAKIPLLALLEQHGKLRSQLLAKLNLSADRDGICALAAQSSLGEQLLEAADQLHNLLEQCQSANLRNGRLIRTGQSSTSSMLNILRGSELPSLYDSTGTKAKIGQQRPLSQA